MNLDETIEEEDSLIRVQLATMIHAAKESGEIIKRFYGKKFDVQTKKADLVDYVTEVDLRVEAKILQILNSNLPGYSCLSEEAGERLMESENRWIIDPIDGTLNFMNRLPFFSVSIGLESKGEIICGVIYNPITNDLYTGSKNRGSQIHGTPIQSSITSDLKNATIAVTLDKDYDYRARVLAMLQEIQHDFKNLICVQSSSITFGYLAEGKIDAVIDIGHYWDFAAAKIIAEEAKLKVTDWKNNPFEKSSKFILAANPVLHRQLVERLSVLEPRSLRILKMTEVEKKVA